MLLPLVFTYETLITNRRIMGIYIYTKEESRRMCIFKLFNVCTGHTLFQSLLTRNDKVIGPRMIHQIHLFTIDQHL